MHRQRYAHYSGLFNAPLRNEEREKRLFLLIRVVSGIKFRIVYIIHVANDTIGLVIIVPDIPVFILVLFRIFINK